MPKRKVRKPLRRTISLSTSISEAQVNFTFFNSKLFLALLAVALIVIAFAVITSINNDSSSIQTHNDFRIDTSTLKNDPSANQLVNP